MPIDSPQTTAAPPRYAVIFTTYGWDAFTEGQYLRNAARVVSGDMHVVVDESHGAVAVPSHCRKTVASQTVVADLGLRIAYHRALFWHNIDYLYYVFFDRHPDYDYYLFLDYDAVVDTDVDTLIEEIARRGIDLVGNPLDCDMKDWTLAEQHAATYGADVLDARISAITILSRRAVSHLFARRRAMSVAPTPEQQSFWPFCEAFVPSELKMAGFVSAELREFGNVESFAWWPPTLDETLSDAGTPTFVHPVLDRPRYIDSMLRHSRTADFLWPNTRLWRAMRGVKDRRWLRPLAAEFIRRCLRVLGLRRGKEVAAITVGMRWTL